MPARPTKASRSGLPDVLGPIEDEVPGIARAAIGRPEALVREWWVDDVAYQIGSPTTAALLRVRGVAVDGDRIVPWSVFVKVLQAWRHWPLIDLVPAELGRRAATEWRFEAEAYGSDLGARLPPGLRPPRLHRLQELGDDRVALWLEDVVTADAAWDRDRFRRAALLLGRMAGRTAEWSDLLQRRAGRDPRSWMRLYARTRLELVALPAIERDDTWADPLLSAAVDDELRSDLAELARRLPSLLDILDELPQVPTHGDACPQNLLVADDDPDGFVAVDWAMAHLGAVGFDLGQLIMGLAHDGMLGVAELAELHDDVLDAYAEGLAGEGVPVDLDDVRRGLDAGLAVRSAFTALPLDVVDAPPTDDLPAFMAARAALTRYLVDLGLGLAVDRRTAGRPPA
jgi:hypothetical protein